MRTSDVLNRDNLCGYFSISQCLLTSLLVFVRREENTLSNSARSLRDSCEVICTTNSHNRPPDSS